MDDNAEILLRESDWLHALAARLVADPGRAADAAQETLLAGVRHRGRMTRSWLGAVLRNAIRQQHRSGTRRADHEHQSFEHATESATVDVATRLDVQRHVIDAIESLDEPYRTAITLRFLEDRPPREIAAQLGVPAKTIRARVDRGLARLRGRLDEVYEGRAAWIALLGPLARPRTPIVAGGKVFATGTGVIAMSTFGKVVLVGSVVALVGFGLSRWRPSQPSIESLSAAAEPEVDRASSASKPPELDPERTARAARVAPPSTPSAAPTGAPPTRSWPTFRGRVVDAVGRGVGDLEVRFEATSFDDDPLPPEARSTRSAADGGFELGLEDVRGFVTARDGDRTTIVAPGVAGQPTRPPVVVVGPARSYAGRVVDAEGHAVPDAELSLRLPPSFRAKFVPGLRDATPLHGRARSAKDGSFRFTDIGFVNGTVLSVEAAGFTPLEVDLPSQSAADLLLPLDPSSAEVALRGRVVDEAGQPLAGAWVAAGGPASATGPDGAFVLPLENTDSTTVVRALGGGRLPVALELGAIPVEERQALELVLIGEARTIKGRVVDALGDPIPDALVWTPDGDYFGSLPSAAGENHSRAGAWVEDLLASELGGDGRETVTSAEGNFQLTGLTSREYEVFALHPASYEVARARIEPSTASERELVLELAGRERAANVHGRVIASTGEAVGGATLRVSRRLQRADGRTVHAENLNGATFTADNDGRFAIHGLAYEGVRFFVYDVQRGIGANVDLDDFAELDDITIVLPSPCHLRVHLNDPASADAFYLLDRDDERVALSYMRGSVTYGARNVRITDGASVETRTDDTARTIVLVRGEAEVLRAPVSLTPGEVVDVRL